MIFKMTSLFIRYLAIALMAPALIVIVGCGGSSTSTPPVLYLVPELKYHLISEFGGVFYCDPDMYPVANPGQELVNALEHFPEIRADQAEFSAILEHLGLPDKAEYTNDEILQIYREHKKLLFGVQLTAADDNYEFVIRVGENQGERIEGAITPSGKVKIQKRESSFNTCPICLSEGTMIDTPNGQVAVEQIREGMDIWTIDCHGNRVVAKVIETAMTPVSMDFEMVKITLNDGRTVTASPGHPTVEGKALSSYCVGEILDGSIVTAVEKVLYKGRVTYDILPSGTTHGYWANEVLLKSTLFASR